LSALQLAPAAIFALAVVAGGIERGVVATRVVGVEVELGLLAAGDGTADEAGAGDAGDDWATETTTDDGGAASIEGKSADDFVSAVGRGVLVNVFESIDTSKFEI
jgi:hypothetical protein